MTHTHTKPRNEKARVKNYTDRETNRQTNTKCAEKINK